MGEASRLAAIEAGRARRVAATGKAEVRFEWFLDKVMNGLSLTMRQRVRLATEHLKSQVVRNISTPVVKSQGTRSGRIVVTERSKPGEFPRADTTQLLKTIISDVVETSKGVFDGFVGTPLSYGVILEVSELDRKFLTRTLNEERDVIEQMLTGPIS
jgi:hypothetical protein